MSLEQQQDWLVRCGDAPRNDSNWVFLNSEWTPIAKAMGEDHEYIGFAKCELEHRIRWSIPVARAIAAGEFKTRALFEKSDSIQKAIAVLSRELFGTSNVMLAKELTATAYAVSLDPEPKSFEDEYGGSEQPEQNHLIVELQNLQSNLLARSDRLQLRAEMDSRIRMTERGGSNVILLDVHKRMLITIMRLYKKMNGKLPFLQSADKEGPLERLVLQIMSVYYPAIGIQPESLGTIKSRWEKLHSLTRTSLTNFAT